MLNIRRLNTGIRKKYRCLEILGIVLVLGIIPKNIFAQPSALKPNTQINQPAGIKSLPQSQIQSDEKYKLWSDHRFLVSPGYFMTSGNLKDVLPDGFGVHINYQLGPDKILKRLVRNLFLPGLQAEISFLHLTGNFSAKETLISGNLGPIWMFFPWAKHSGAFFASPMIGLTYISAIAQGYSGSGMTTGMHITTGYNYFYKKYILTSALRYSQFFDATKSLTGFGLSIGMGYRL